MENHSFQMENLKRRSRYTMVFITMAILFFIIVVLNINTDGTVVVRKSDDYIPAMIEIAGGRYAFSDLKNPDNNAPSVKLTMEEFYAKKYNLYIKLVINILIYMRS